MATVQPPRKVKYADSKARRAYSFRVPLPVYEKVCTLVPDAGARLAFAQIYVGTLRADQIEDMIDGCRVWVPIPCVAWGQFTEPATATWMALREMGHCQVTDPNVGLRCRRFSLDPGLILELLRLSLSSMDCEWVNLFTGRSVRKNEIREPRKQKGGKRGRPTRTCRVEMAFQDACREALRLLDLAERIGSAHWRAHAISAVAGLSAIRSSPSFHWRRNRPGWASYIPVYERGDNGRLYEVGGGIQCLPRSIKQVLLLGTDSTLTNVDLRRCHLAGYSAVASALNSWRYWQEQRGEEPSIPYVSGMQETKEAIEGPRSTKHGRLYGIRDLVRLAEPFKAIGDRCGLPEDVVKSTVYGIINGASLRRQTWKTKDGVVELGSIAKLLVRHCGTRPAALAALRRLRPELALVEKSADSFAKVLSTIIRNPSCMRGAPHSVLRILRIVRRHGEVFLENAAGGELQITDADTMAPKDVAALARRAASHTLTGIEQETMGLFRELCESAGIGVACLEHDGAVVTAPIPEWIEDELRKRTILASYAQLRVKPFYPPEEKSELDELCARVLGTAHSAKIVEIAPREPRESFLDKIEREDSMHVSEKIDDEPPSYLAERLVRIGQRPAPEPEPELPREPYCPPDWEIAMGEEMARAVEGQIREKEERERKREERRRKDAEFAAKLAEERKLHAERKAREAQRPKLETPPDPEKMTMPFREWAARRAADGDPEQYVVEDPDRQIPTPWGRRYGESRTVARWRWEWEQKREFCLRMIARREARQAKYGPSPDDAASELSDREQLAIIADGLADCEQIRLREVVRLKAEKERKTLVA